MDKRQHIIVWEGMDWKSMECLSWQMNEEGTLVTSHITGVIDQTAFAIHYLIEIDSNWHTEHILVSDLNNPNNILDLYSDKKGKWYDKDELISSAHGCLDIDISLTPFTNTLPLKRMQVEMEKRNTVEVMYIKLPEFRLDRKQQHYTLLPGGKVLFETGDGSFKTELELDNNWIVIDYPGLAKRIFPTENHKPAYIKEALHHYPSQ